VRQSESNAKFLEGSIGASFNSRAKPRGSG